MDLSRKYNHSGLEAKRKKLLEVQKAERALSRAKVRRVRALDAIRLAAEGKPVGALSEAVGRAYRELTRRPRERLHRFLMALAVRRSRLLDDATWVVALVRIGERLGWAVRGVETWKVPGYNAQRQMQSLLRHLFCLYPMPVWFDSAWTSKVDCPTWRRWYVQVGQGASLRSMPEVPIAMTKRMMHFAMLAPNEYDVAQAIRWGQVRGMGGTAAVAAAVVAASAIFTAEQEPFWATVIQFMAAHPMLDPHQVGPIIDYIRSRKFVPGEQMVVEGRVVGGVIAEPNFSMKGRTAESLLRQVERWHRELARVPRGSKSRTWRPCGIEGMQRVEGTEPKVRIISIRELCSSAELMEEGRQLKHCVYSYTESCESGRRAIFSLRVDEGRGEERLITLEVAVKLRQIVQARGRYNRAATLVEQRIVRGWAVQSRLEIAGYVFA